MPALPEDRPATTPWPLYPRTLKVDYGQEEAIHLQGQDPRVYETTVTEVTKGKVHTVKVQWERTESGLRPVPIAGSEKILPADLILVAMGFTGPEDTLKDYILQTRRSGGERLAGVDFATGIPGVFAAGDMRRGQSLVVWAIKEGLDAAKACSRYLRHI
jgi:glutamate synthase (NADPH/NADH) small chain